MALLDILLECTAHSNGDLLRRVVADTNALLVDLALDARVFSTPVDNPLAQPECTAAIESATLVFVSRLARGWRPSWILRDTFLGTRVRRLARELWRPRPGSPADQARAALAERWDAIEATIVRFVADVDDGTWPSGAVCEQLADGLRAGSEGTSAEVGDWIRDAAGLLRAIADEGVAGWQLRYMSAVTERARIQSLAGQAGIRGAVENAADDVARPLLRQSRRVAPRPRRANRARLCHARGRVVSRWMYRHKPRWTRAQLARLEAIPEVACS